jgi:hypothetical protein
MYILFYDFKHALNVRWLRAVRHPADIVYKQN